jgi:hypothetical protein
VYNYTCLIVIDNKIIILYIDAGAADTVQEQAHSMLRGPRVLIADNAYAEQISPEYRRVNGALRTARG